MRNFKIYFLRHFFVCNIAVLTIFTMLYIRSPELIHIRTGSLYPLTTFASLPLPSTKQLFSLKKLRLLNFSISFIFILFYIFIFTPPLRILFHCFWREEGREEGNERKGKTKWERNINWLPPACAQTRDHYNLGMWPWQGMEPAAL